MCAHAFLYDMYRLPEEDTMAVLTQEMRNLVAAQQCFIATVNPDGTPNVGPKRSTRVLDNEYLAFNELTSKQTWTNVKSGSKVAIAVVDREAMKARGMMAPLTAVVKVKVEKIYNLGMPGAGEQLA